MTDEEEMARLYLIEKYGLRKDIELDIIEHGILSIEFCTYLAGLKAGTKLGFEKGMKAKVNTTTISDYPAKSVGHSEDVICSLSAALDYAKLIMQDLLDDSDEYARQRAIDFLRKVAE
jgi:hypothetical protein